MADELTDRIKVGSTQEEVIAIMGGKPNETDCTTRLGIKTCTLSWRRAVFDKTTFTAFFYEISFIADRSVSTNLITKQGTFKP